MKRLLILFLVMIPIIIHAQYVPLSVNTNTGYINIQYLRPATNLHIESVVIENFVDTNGMTNAASVLTNRFEGAGTTGLVSSTTSETNKFLKGDGTWSTPSMGDLAYLWGINAEGSVQVPETLQTTNAGLWNLSVVDKAVSIRISEVTDPWWVTNTDGSVSPR